MRFVVNNQVTIISGDSTLLCVPLTLEKQKFIPGIDYELSATFKLLESALDLESAFQKTTGAGIEHDGDKAFLNIVYLDTTQFKNVMLYGGIVAQHIVTGKRYTVAKFKCHVEYDPQFELNASVDIHTSQPLNTTNRILSWLMGVAADPTKIGVEYLFTALTLTAPPVDGVVGVAASSTVAITGVNPSAGATLTIAGRVYTFVAVSTSTASEIVMDATGANTIDNLIQALNAPSFGTANADVLANSFGGSTLVLQARGGGTAGNGLTISSSSIRVTCANLAGGVDAVTGTIATAIGQLAIVTTTTASGTFLDVWTAAAIAPVTIWRPPGNIKKDRSNGLLYREFYSGGTPATELAYP